MKQFLGTFKCLYLSPADTPLQNLHMKYQLYPRSILNLYFTYDTAQRMKFSIKDFFSKCDQIRNP